MAAVIGEMAVRASRLHRLGAVAASLALVAACQATATPSPIVTSSPTPSGSNPATASPPAESPAASPSRVAAHWEAAGATAVYRSDGTAVALGSGRVLVLGNAETSEGSEPATSGEIWDPATNAWTPIENINKVRRDFVAVPLGEDRVLVAGGLNGDDPPASYSSAYIYDARAGQEGWSKTGLMVAARTGPGAARLPDGRILVAGGYYYVHSIADGGPATAAVLAAYHSTAPGGENARPGLDDIDVPPSGAALATAEIFDPKTGTWSSTGSMVYARYRPRLATLADGRILVVGSAGYGAEGDTVMVDERAFDSAEIYDPATGRFGAVGTLPGFDRAALAALGGPGANPMPTDDGAPYLVGSLVATRDGGAVLIGHANWWKHEADITRSFRFDVATGAWSEIGQTYVFVGEPTRVPLWSPGVRELSSALVSPIPDGRILVAGGGGPNEFGETGSNEVRSTDAAELYDPATNTWSPLPPMPEPRRGGAIVALPDGSTFLVGGENYNGEEWTFLTSATRFVP